MPHYPAILKILFALGLAVTLGLLWLLLRKLGMPGSLSPDELASWLGSSVWGPVLLMLLMVLAVVVGPVPTLPISAASGLAFGVFGGTAVAAAGASLGALVAFWTARLLGRDVLCRWLGTHPFFHPEAPQRVLFCGVLLTRLIPLFSFALISYAAGLTAITTVRFLLASLIGMLPMTVVFAGLGHSLQINPTLTVVAAGLLLVLMLVAPRYLGNRFGGRLNAWLTGGNEARNDRDESQEN